MKYGITRNNTQDEIFSALKKHEKLRYGELAKIVVEKNKICSDRIFRETLALMVNTKMVKKFEIARNNTLYTIDSKITPLTDEHVKEMVEAIDDLKEETQGIIDMMSSNADDSEKSKEVIQYLLLLSMYEMQIMMLAYVTGKPKLKLYSRQLTKNKKTVLDSLNTKSSSMFSNLGARVYGKLFLEAMKQSPDFYLTQ